MKNHKGTVPALLTLGLVLVGTLITLGSSFFVNKTKIASNSRAATVNCVYSSRDCNAAKESGDCGPTPINCAKCKNGLYRCQGTDDSPLITNTPIPAATDVPAAASSPYVCKKGGTAFETSEACYDFCSGQGMEYPGNDQGTIGSQHYCCCNSGPGSADYPADDSCWLIKCRNGSKEVTQYSDSLSRYDIPLSSCNETPAYQGILVLGEVAADNYSCDGTTGVAPPTRNAPTSAPELEPTTTDQTTPALKPTPLPGKKGGSCKKLFREDGIWNGDCDSGLTCDPQTGKCINNRSGRKTPIATLTLTPSPTLSPNAGTLRCTVVGAATIDDVVVDEEPEIGQSKDVSSSNFAEETPKYYVVRYKKSNGSCGYDCISKTTNQRKDCWAFQVNANSSSTRNNIIIKNNKAENITIKQIVLVKKVVTTSSTVTLPLNKDVASGSFEVFSFLGTDAQCNVSPNQGILLYISVTYSIDGQITMLPTLSFDCEDDFSGLININ